MNPRRWIALSSFTLLLLATAGGLVLTRPLPPPATVDPSATSTPAPQAPQAPQAAQAPPAPKPGKGGKGGKASAKAAPKAAPTKERLVDESPLITARRCMPLATSPAEQILARQAERVANHEVDLAFADALRRAQEQPIAATPQAQELLRRREEAEATLERDRKELADLEKRFNDASSRQKEALQDQLEVAKAEIELDEDEVEQAKEALDRAGGDPQGRIQRLKAAHNAVEPAASLPPLDAAPRTPSLLNQLLQLRTDTRKVAQLRQAWLEATDKCQRMIQRRATVAQRVEQENQQRNDAKEKAKGFTRGEQQTDASSRDEAKANLKSLQHYTADQRRLANFGRRIQDQTELADAYANWITLAETQQRATLHATLKWILAILGLLAGAYLVGRYLEHLFNRLLKGADRVGRMPKMAKFVVDALGVLAALVMLFGLPSEMTTLFGLAGAGLTVALKDFIMAFFGWFILVGRNGIKVGDWVEIKGVGGEVVEIGLLRTLLLETGNWKDASHPTGRVVSFVNSFAMEGHFFNFSSKGQWMWDELRVLVPQEQDPYTFIASIQNLVAGATGESAEEAQKEWSRSSRKARIQAVSAQPSVDVVPTALGFEIRVRYVTRAYERQDTKRHLNQALLELLVGKRAEPQA